MSDWLVFEDQQTAQAAADKIYSNMVAGVDSPDLLDVTTDQVFEQSELDDQQRIQYGADNRRFPVFGRNALSGAKETEVGYTTAWAVPQQTVNGTWVFASPDAKLLNGVSGYIVEPFNPNWFLEGA